MASVLNILLVVVVLISIAYHSNATSETQSPESDEQCACKTCPASIRSYDIKKFWDTNILWWTVKSTFSREYVTDCDVRRKNMNVDAETLKLEELRVINHKLIHRNYKDWSLFNSYGSETLNSMVFKDKSLSGNLSWTLVHANRKQTCGVVFILKTLSHEYLLKHFGDGKSKGSLKFSAEKIQSMKDKPVEYEAHYALLASGNNPADEARHCKDYFERTVKAGQARTFYDNTCKIYENST
uniref:Lipocalin n=1 Tax=Rhipicephalus zambeziensis TaxID=60191 RepID=A0A224YID0_9ACAR